MSDATDSDTRPGVTDSNAAQPSDAYGGERTPTAERDQRGRFRPGNKAAVNRQPPLGSVERQRRFREALMAAFEPGELAEAARSMLNEARRGDVAAFLALAAYAIGKPIQQEPEAGASVSETLAALYHATMGPVTESERVAELEAENERLRLEASAAASELLLAPAPRQELLPGRVSLPGVRLVEREERAAEARLRKAERLYGVTLRRPEVELTDDEIVAQQEPPA